MLTWNVWGFNKPSKALDALRLIENKRLDCLVYWRLRFSNKMFLELVMVWELKVGIGWTTTTVAIVEG